MPMCFDVECSHCAIRDPCKLYRFPKDLAERSKWNIVIKRRIDRTPDFNNDRVCSCHFIDGKKENGPTIFKSNAAKLSTFCDPEIKQRSKRRKVGSQDLVNVTDDLTDVVDVDAAYPVAAIGETDITSACVGHEEEAEELKRKISFVRYLHTNRRRTDVPGLPPGWKREEVVRKSGLSVGKTDVYYLSPDGRKACSKSAIAKMLSDKFDLAGFDFRSGRVLHMNIQKRVRHDASLVLPIRQTASIFKQPVTVIRNHPDSKTRTDIRHGPQEQPKQLFWEKRLEGLTASDADGETLNALQLPSAIQGTSPELVQSENLLQSIASALHLSNQPVVGQNVSKTLLQRNPSVNCNVDQPLIQNVMVTDQDIAKQEMKVYEARKRLQRAMASVNAASHKEL